MKKQLIFKNSDKKIVLNSNENNDVYLRENYYSNFEIVFQGGYGYPSEQNIVWIDTSYDGKHLVVIGERIWWSNDYGDTWSYKKTDPNYYKTRIYNSQDGKVIVWFNQDSNDHLYISLDYGYTWEEKENGPIYPANGFVNDKFVAITCWDDHNSLVYDIENDTHTYSLKHKYDVAFSYNGHYRVWGDYNSNYLAYSNDSGTTYTNIALYNINSHEMGDIEFIDMDNSGQYIIFSTSEDVNTNKYNIYLSNDYTQTWTNPLTVDHHITTVNISYDGRLMVVGVNQTFYYMSTDYGVNWNKIDDDRKYDPNIGNDIRIKHILIQQKDGQSIIYRDADRSTPHRGYRVYKSNNKSII